MSGPFDSFSQLSLVFSTVTRNPAGTDLSPFSDIVLESTYSLKIYILDLTLTELARAFPPDELLLRWFLLPPH